MKRLIKYWSPYNDIKFSDCSTKYELLPIIVEDSEGSEKLLELAAELKLDTRTKEVSKFETRSYRGLEISHSVELAEIKLDSGFSGKVKEMVMRLGFITIPKSNALKSSKKLNKKVTLEQANEIINNQELGVSDVAEIDGNPIVVMSGWDYCHGILVLGYSLISFEKHYGVNDKEVTRAFEDSVSCCGECGEWDHNDNGYNGYNNNFRVLDCELYGVSCGCYAEACVENIDSFVDDAKQCIESDTAETLLKDGKLVKVESFVGGMTDSGRVHNFNGKRVRTSNPESVLKEFKKKYPKAGFVFVREESGKFQTYYTLYKVRKTPMVNMAV